MHKNRLVRVRKQILVCFKIPVLFARITAGIVFANFDFDFDWKCLQVTLKYIWF